MSGLKTPPIDPLRLLLFKILKERISQEETEGTEQERVLNAEFEEMVNDPLENPSN